MVVDWREEETDAMRFMKNRADRKEERGRMLEAVRMESLKDATAWPEPSCIENWS